MNYVTIHDSIIERGQKRINQNLNYESHHITPKCEGGGHLDPQVLLTQKEHRLIHKLRYKINHNVGNLLAYNLMKYGRNYINKNKNIISSLGGKAHHKKMHNKDPVLYKERQRLSGLKGGNKCKIERIGFFALTEIELNESRKRGRETIVKNKLGMFSDEYREKHRLNLFKKIETPDGIFNSITEATRYYNTTPGNITYRLKSEKEQWKKWNYIGDKNE